MSLADALRRAREAQTNDPGAPFRRVNEARGRSLSERLAETRRAKALESLEADESGFIDQMFLEDQAGGVVSREREIDDPFLKRALAKRETPDLALSFLQNNPQYLPDGAVPVALNTRDEGYKMGYRLPGDPNVYLINDDTKVTLGDYGTASADIISAETVGGMVAEVFNPLRKVKLAGKAAGKIGKGLLGAGRAAFAGTGAAVGRGVDETVEGFDEGEGRDVMDTLAKMGESLAWGMGGQQAGEIFERTGNLAAGRGFRIGDANETEKPFLVQQQEAIEAAKRQNLSITRGQLGDLKSQRAESQYATLNAEFAHRLEQPYSDMAEGLQGQVGEIEGLSDDALLKAVEKERAAVERYISGKLGLPAHHAPGGAPGRNVVMEDIGSDLVKYKELTSAQASRGFAELSEAAMADGVQFDATEVATLARNALEADYLAGKPKTVEPDFLDREVGIGPRTVREDVAVQPNLDPSLKGILQQLSQIDNLQGPERLDALRNIEKRLARLGRTPTLQGTESQAVAQDVRHAILRSYDNAVGGERFNSILAREKAAWATRSRTLRAFDFMKEVVDGEVGAGTRAYRHLVNSEWDEGVYNTLRQVLPKERMDELRFAVYSDMIENPERIDTILRNIPDLRFMSKDTRRVFRELQVLRSRENAGAVFRSLQSVGDDVTRVRQVVSGSQPGDLDQLVSSGAMKQGDLRTAVFASILDESSSLVKGEIKIDPSRLRRAIDKYRKSGALRHLEPHQIEMLNDYELLSSFYEAAKASAGDSLVSAASVSSLITPVGNPRQAADAALKIAQTGYAAKLSAYQGLTEATKAVKDRPYDLAYLRALGLYSASVLRRESQSFDREEQN